MTKKRLIPQNFGIRTWWRWAVGILPAGDFSCMREKVTTWIGKDDKMNRDISWPIRNRSAIPRSVSCYPSRYASHIISAPNIDGNDVTAVTIGSELIELYTESWDGKMWACVSLGTEARMTLLATPVGELLEKWITRCRCFSWDREETAILLGHYDGDCGNMETCSGYVCYCSRLRHRLSWRTPFMITLLIKLNSCIVLQVSCIFILLKYVAILHSSVMTSFVSVSSLCWRKYEIPTKWHTTVFPEKWNKLFLSRD
jgi:hypothetical protein